MDKQEVEIKMGLPDQDLKLKVKGDPYLADYHFTMVKEDIQTKSEAIENREQGVPINNDKYMMIKEEFSETRHITLVHEKNKPYRWTFECNVCSKRFGSKSEFYRHFAKVHEKNKPYRWTFQCTICQSKFGSKSEFDRHFATVHDKNTPYGCSICFKVLDAKATVKEHIA